MYYDICIDTRTRTVHLPDRLSVCLTVSYGCMHLLFHSTVRSAVCSPHCSRRYTYTHTLASAAAHTDTCSGIEPVASWPGRFRSSARSAALFSHTPSRHTCQFVGRHRRAACSSSARCPGACLRRLRHLRPGCTACHSKYKSRS